MNSEHAPAGQFDEIDSIRGGGQGRGRRGRARPIGAPSSEHITGRAKRTPVSDARSLASVVPANGSAYGTGRACGASLVVMPSQVVQPRDGWKATDG